MRSTDAGVTWSEVGRVDVGGGDVLLTAGHGRVIVTLQEDDSLVLAYFPGFERLTPPEPDLSPLAFVDGRVAWHSFESGQVWLGDQFLHDFGNSNHVSDAFEVTTGAKPEIGVSVQTPNGAEYHKLDLTGRLLSSYQYDRLALAHLDLGKGLVVGNATIDPSRLTQPLPEGWSTWFPAVFDLTNREIRPVVEGFSADASLRNGRNHVLAVQSGPFLRVVNTGSCINVREAPDSAAPVLECVADNVLLLDVASASRLVAQTPISNSDWLEVRTPSGKRGYASTNYLER